jgi:hypothetical protein
VSHLDGLPGILVKRDQFVTSQYLCTFLFFYSFVQALTKQNMSSNHPSLKEKNEKLLKEVDEVSGV